MKIKTASELKAAIEAAGTNPHFFSRANMKFFGDRMSNYGLRFRKEILTTAGEIVPAYELRRKTPVNHGLQMSTYFHAETLERVLPEFESP